LLSLDYLDWHGCCDGCIVGIPPAERSPAMFVSLAARAAHLTAAIVSAALLTAFVTVLPVPAQAELYAPVTIVHR
jgi:hypothetical protein